MHRRHAEALAQIIEASVDQTAGFRWMLSVYDATWPWMGIGTVRREALWIASTIQEQAVVDSALRSLARSENALQPLVQAVVDEARSRRDSEGKVLNPLLPPVDASRAPPVSPCCPKPARLERWRTKPATRFACCSPKTSDCRWNLTFCGRSPPPVTKFPVGWIPFSFLPFGTEPDHAF